MKLAPGDDQLRPVLASSIELLRIIASTFNEGWGLGEDDAVRKIEAEVPTSNEG
jgi:hypothetical protein